MSFVVDSSVALSWCFEDERTPTTKALLIDVGESGAHVPQHWPLEVMNGLIMAERRKRITAATRKLLGGFLHALPLEIDNDTLFQLWDATQTLAAPYKLTIYDAAYLELAQRKDLPLATLDKELRKAARHLDIPLLGLKSA